MEPVPSHSRTESKIRMSRLSQRIESICADPALSVRSAERSREKKTAVSV